VEGVFRTHGVSSGAIMTIFGRILLIVLAMAWISNAAAACNPMQVPPPRYVGVHHEPAQPGDDPLCTDNDIQTAIENACPNASVIITHEHTYTAQHLTITDKNVTLIGAVDGVACGSSPIGTGPGGTTPPLPTTYQLTISGEGHTGDSVIAIHGTSNVTLQYLDITAGTNDSDNFGGGIFFGGSGSLTLDTTTVDHNYAGHGGGIDVFGSDRTRLTLKHYSQILNNTAQYNGGGIRLQGNAYLQMFEENSTVAFNTALGVSPGSDPQFKEGFGGGIAVFGPAAAEIASSGTPFSGAVSDNVARFGGGIAAIATSSGNARAQLFTVDAAHPVLISQNEAKVAGGGIYLRPDDNFPIVPNGTSVCALNFRINLNKAPEGAAIQGDATDNTVTLNVGTDVLLNTDFECGYDQFESFGSKTCLPGVPCNEISGNIVTTPTQGERTGAIVNIKAFGSISADRLVMRDNDSAQLIKTGGLVGGTGLTNCLLVDNRTDHELIQGFYGRLILDNCTIAQNVIDNGYVFFIKDYFTLKHTIIYQPGVQTLDYQADSCAGDSSCLKVSEVITNDKTFFPPDAQLVFPYDPLFVDPTNPNIDKRDYHLRAEIKDGSIVISQAIDFAEAHAGDHDVENNPRDQNVPEMVDFEGPRDLGAFEAQPVVSRIFADAFGDAIRIAY
jgi:hypothetical protein